MVPVAAPARAANAQPQSQSQKLLAFMANLSLFLK
jgi:hypothetical protein